MNFNQTITEGGEIILGNGRQQKDLAEIRYFCSRWPFITVIKNGGFVADL